MLTVIETQQRRTKLHRMTTSFLNATTQSPLDNNNSAKSKTKVKQPKPVQPKTEPAKGSENTNQEITKDEKIKPKKEKKKIGKISISLPSGLPKGIKIKKVQLPNRKPKQKEAQIEEAQPFTEIIASEEVFVNRVHLHDEKEEKKIQLKSPGPKTPENYGRSVEFYRHINQARATFLGAATRAGLLLMTGQVEGDVDDWDQFCRERTEKEKQWRRECRERDRARERESRKVVEGAGTCCFAVRKFGAWMKAQFEDIFPCCLPE
ncbi:uncharacterized protein [Haliotis asinina]|uniref:uncharacterized protein n=1 Tax=Haliotis asinina TaxID=109174 RepID=UPI0035327231